MFIRDGSNIYRLKTFHLDVQQQKQQKRSIKGIYHTPRNQDSTRLQLPLNAKQALLKHKLWIFALWISIS
jgi:hypothetical protein